MEFLNEQQVATAYDKEEWVRQKKAERESAYSVMDQMAELIGIDGSRLKDYLDVQARFGLYSVGNVLLITAQKPDAVMLNDYQAWKEMGASINKGEKGIIILEPGKSYTRPDGTAVTGFNAKRVFDISQTTKANDFRPKIKRDGKLLLKALIKYAPCDVRADEDSRVPQGRIALYDSKTKSVYVESGHSEEELFQAITRELAYDYMSHEIEERDIHRLSAECISYILCQRNQVDTSTVSFEHLPESFSRLDAKDIRKELSVIRNISNQMTLDMNRFFEKQKERTGLKEAR